jgi:hypothetical protein
MISRTERVSQISDAVIAQAVRDVNALQDAGEWMQAKECCWAAFHDWRHGGMDDNLAIDFLAQDVADLLGINRERVRALAHKELIGSRASVMLSELRAQAAALNRTAPTNGRPSGPIARANALAVANRRQPRRRA